MKVILTETIKKVGNKGDVIEVSSGYASNFLLPRKKAVIADNVNLEKLKRENAKKEHDRQEEIKAAKVLKEKIEKTHVEIRSNAGENGRLFGTITAKEIVDALNNKCGILVDKKKIKIENAIKQIGMHEVLVKLDKEVAAVLKIMIIGMEK